MERHRETNPYVYISYTLRKVKQYLKIKWPKHIQWQMSHCNYLVYRNLKTLSYGRKNLNSKSLNTEPGPKHNAK